MTPPQEPASEQEPPPVLGSWRRLYLVLVLELLLITVLSYALSRWAS